MHRYGKLLQTKSLLDLPSGVRIQKRSTEVQNCKTLCIKTSTLSWELSSWQGHWLWKRHWHSFCLQLSSFNKKKLKNNNKKSDKSFCSCVTSCKMTRQTQLTVNVIVIILPFKILFSKNICELHEYALLSLMIILDSIKLKTTEMSGDCAGIFFQLQTGLFLKQNADIHTLVWGRQKQLVTLCCRVHNDIIL